MSSQKVIEESEKRKERLAEHFKSHPALWEDLKAEITDYLEDSRWVALGHSCKDRDYYSGKCMGFKSVIDLGDRLAS